MMKLICLPFAGGSSHSFGSWSKYLGEDIDIVAIEYAGRGTRFDEDPIEGIKNNLLDIFDKVEQNTCFEYAIFGHSMGALYAYELVCMIEKKGLKPPKKVIVSGSDAPHAGNKEILHVLNKDEFMQKLYNLGGIADEIMEEEEIIDLFYPILFCDVKNYETYMEMNKDKIPESISTQMTVFYGKEDTDFCSEEDIKRWQDCCKTPISSKGFDGGHFFIFDNEEQVCNSLKDELLT